jgi:excisionase family DNA binding protein
MNTLIAIDETRIDRLESQLRDLKHMIEGATIHPKPEWVPVPEAARELGVSTATIRRWARDGRIEARGAGKARRVHINRGA